MQSPPFWIVSAFQIADKIVEAVEFEVKAGSHCKYAAQGRLRPTRNAPKLLTAVSVISDAVALIGRHAHTWPAHHEGIVYAARHLDDRLASHSREVAEALHSLLESAQFRKWMPPEMQNPIILHLAHRSYIISKDMHLCMADVVRFCFLNLPQHKQFP